MAVKKTVRKKPLKLADPATVSVEVAALEIALLWDQARLLEAELEKELLDDAVKSARLALDELHAETKTQPFERRRGLRLREKAQRVERAFNRLRALRK